jgi:hypothetical protein
MEKRKIRSQLFFIDQGKELCTAILEKNSRVIANSFVKYLLNCVFFPLLNSLSWKSLLLARNSNLDLTGFQSFEAQLEMGSVPLE